MMRLKRTDIGRIVWLGMGFLASASSAWGNTLPEVESLSGGSSWREETTDLSLGTHLNTFQAPSDTEHLGRTQQVNPVAQNPMLSLFQRIDALQDELQELRGRLEEQQYQIQNLKQRQPILGKAAQVEHSSEFIAGALDAQWVSSAKTLAQEDEEQAAPAEIRASHQAITEEKAYNTAYQLIQNRDYERALAAFKSMIKTFPNGHYAPNGYYWMGEVYMILGELELAANAFNTVYHEYPKHAKSADALLKLGYVEYAKGQWERSRELLAQVQDQFPGTASAHLASTRLQRMQQEPRM